jgi:hypothetical protein
VGLLAPKLSGLFFAPERGIMIKKPSLLCEDYSYGHSPHFNQARRAWEEKQFPVKVRYLGSDLFKVILENGRSLQLHNHEPCKLLEHIEEYSNGQLTYSIRFQLLGVKTDGFGTSMFSMSAESLKPCQVTNKKKKTYGFFESDLPPGDSDGPLGSGSGSTNG